MLFPKLNTPPASICTQARIISLPDGHSSSTPGYMHRENEGQLGRHEPSFPGLHNLHKSIFNCQLRPLEPCEEGYKWRMMLRDLGAEAVLEALEDIPAGSHITVYADSGPCDLEFEDLLSWETVPGAYCAFSWWPSFGMRRPLASAQAGASSHIVSGLTRAGF